MEPLSRLRECISRAFGRKWAPISLTALFLLGFVLGLIFSRTPAFYEYHLRAVDRYLDRVVYSDGSVVGIFFARFAGNAVILILLTAGGVHPLTLVLPATVFLFRAYTFGGALAVLFSAYEASGALVAVVLYLPVHLLLDAVFLLAASLAFSRAAAFRFCTSDLCELLLDLAVLLVLILLVCLFEALLLFALFHPLGNLV